MHQLTAADFADFTAARRTCYDTIWIARTHNLALVQKALFQSVRSMALEPRIIIDTEAVLSLREAERAAVSGQAFDLDVALRDEFRHLDPAMHVVAVTEAEAAMIRPYHGGPLSVLGHGIAASPTPRRFEERSGILFTGAIDGVDHPNHDGLAWFIEEVLPLIERALRWETRLTVAGYLAPGATLDRFRGHPRVTLQGPATDLQSLYDTHRVFVGPVRVAAGLSYNVHEAAAFGVPVVATSLLARQVGWPDGDCIGAADATDPEGFAARVVALHRDAQLWRRIRDAALPRVAADLNPGDFAARVARLSHPSVNDAGSYKSRLIQNSTQP